MAEKLPSNVDDPRFSAEPDPPATQGWLGDALEDARAHLPDLLAAFLEAAQRVLLR